MIRSGLLAVAALLFIQTSHTFAADASLKEAIDAIVAAPPFQHALWGIHVTEDDGTVVYDRNGNVLMMTGSTRKLFSAAAIEHCLGPASSVPTEVWLTGTVAGGTLEGDIVVKGYGDPSIGGRFEYDTDRLRRFRPLIETLRERGIRRIDGGVVADVSAFGRDTIPGSWKNDNLGSSYAVPADALAYNENAVGVTVNARSCRHMVVQTDPPILPVVNQLTCGETGEPVIRVIDQNRVLIRGSIGVKERERPYGDLVGVSDPALLFARALDDLLREHGYVPATLPSVATEAAAVRELLLVVESPPVFELLAVVLKNSQNLYTEMLFKRLSWSAEKPATYRDSFEVERDFLEGQVGINGAEFHFDDGSGLSPENLYAPRALVKLLRYLTRDSISRGLYDQLIPAPGEEGTMRTRLPQLAGRLHAKTGTIDQVVGLAGYLITSGGRTRYFAINLNHHLGTASEARAAIDAIVLRIAE